MTPTENAQTDADRRAAACNAQLDSLALTQDRIRKDVAELHYLAQSAHSLGASWKEIGDVLGCSRQAAWERFGQSLRPQYTSNPPWSGKPAPFPEATLPFDLG